MKISDAGRQLIESFESCSLTKYNDIRGIPTIGYGHKILPGEFFTTITQAEADDLFAHDLGFTEDFVSQCIATITDAKQCEFDALCSLTYNIGIGAFQHSTLLQDYLQGDLEDCAQQFLVWDHSNGEVVDGLMRRREAEQTMFQGN